MHWAPRPRGPWNCKTARLTLLIDPNKKAAFERLCAQQDLHARRRWCGSSSATTWRSTASSYGPAARAERGPRAARQRHGRRSERCTRSDAAACGRSPARLAAHRLDPARGRRPGCWSAWPASLALRRLALVARVLFPLGGLLGLALFGVAAGAAGHARGGGAAHRPARRCRSTCGWTACRPSS
ncbi:MAG: hypothetical protein MZW92_34565 [Comamonadaceae bacterium]|nr:hypothetical protein [Comamonadaceae bacterium]